MRFRRDACLSLEFYICWMDDFSIFLNLLSTCASPLSTFSIPVTIHELLGIPNNLELRNVERRGVARLAFNDVGLAGLVENVDRGHARDATRNGSVCADHIWRSLRRDLGADLWGDPAVLSRHPRALRARREKLLIFCLIEFHDKWLDHFSYEGDVILRYNLLIMRK